MPLGQYILNRGRNPWQWLSQALPGRGDQRAKF